MQGAGYDIYYPDYDGVPGYFEIPAGIFIFTCGLWRSRLGTKDYVPGQYYNKGNDSKGDIDNTNEAAEVVDEKSKTKSGKTDLPTMTDIK